MDHVSVKANHRLELAGDWSDLPGYCQVYSGRVINVAVSIPGLALGVQASRMSDPIIKIISQGQNLSQEITDLSKLLSTDPKRDPLYLLKAVLYDMLLRGSLRNLTHNQRVLESGLVIVSNSTAPVGSGLGTSSILATILRIALHLLVNDPLSPADACWQTFEMECSLRLGSGWQDQIGGIFPGIKDNRYSDDTLDIQEVRADSQFIERFKELTVLTYTGQNRFSGDILHEIDVRLKKNSSHEAVKIIHALKEACEPVKKAILSGQYNTVGKMAKEITLLQHSLHREIVPDYLLTLFKTVDEWCHGYRICGAGGSGFLLFYTKNRYCKEHVVGLIESYGFQPYPFSIGTGLTDFSNS